MFRTKCPICGGLLTIDERLRRVVNHRERGEAQKSSEEQFESIVDGIQKAKDTQEERLDRAKQREARRKSHVDELFKKAQEKAEESEDDGKPLGPVW